MYSSLLPQAHNCRAFQSFPTSLGNGINFTRDLFRSSLVAFHLVPRVLNHQGPGPGSTAGHLLLSAVTDPGDLLLLFPSSRTGPVPTLSVVFTCLGTWTLVKPLDPCPVLPLVREEGTYFASGLRILVQC